MGQIRSVASPALPIVHGLFSALAGALLMLLTQFFLRLPFRVSLLVAEAALLAPAVALLVANGIGMKRGLGLLRIRSRTALLSIGAGVSLWLTGLGVLEFQYLFWKPDPLYLEHFRRLFEHLRPIDPVDAVVSIAVVAFVPALFEEALCRGVILPSCANVSRLRSAVAVSALIFAFLHFDAYRSLFAFTVGIGFGALRIYAGSTWAAILAHSTLNTLTYVIALTIK
ncbi:MAG: CPBP family intramembrane metalloprotease, partial [Vicinamibacteria bacterium]|nr:CPBP family intramembrane metalloprotease [Vicinamibacteria bacterium]